MIVFFFCIGPVKEKLEISLFGEIVNRTNFGSDLCKVQRRHVNGIPVLLGCQKPAAQYECGVNVYCEGTMIMPFTLRELSIDDPGDFGATMVIDFPKDVGVIPGPTKVSYNFCSTIVVVGLIAGTTLKCALKNLILFSILIIDIRGEFPPLIAIGTLKPELDGVIFSFRLCRF